IAVTLAAADLVVVCRTRRTGKGSRPSTATCSMSNRVFSSFTSGPTTMRSSWRKEYKPHSIRLQSQEADTGSCLRCFRTVAALLAISLAVSGDLSAMAAATLAPLTLQAKIPLGDVRGRIDHLAIDHARQRLFVAELGNDSLSVIDLKAER